MKTNFGDYIKFSVFTPMIASIYQIVRYVYGSAFMFSKGLSILQKFTYEYEYMCLLMNSYVCTWHNVTAHLTFLKRHAVNALKF